MGWHGRLLAWDPIEHEQNACRGLERDGLGHHRCSPCSVLPLTLSTVAIRRMRLIPVREWQGYERWDVLYNFVRAPDGQICLFLEPP